VALLLAGSAIAHAGRSTPQVTTDDIVGRAGHYVTRFIQAFSNIVIEERYVQDVIGTLPSSMVRGGAHRELRSDLLLVRVGGQFTWRPFRDVFEVGGTPVRDRDERLAKLFLEPSPRLLEQAQRIATESARYNIGVVVRTVNTPVHTLLFLQPSLQPRFRFNLDKRDPEAGANVWIVKYEEHARPTLIRGDRDADLPAFGRFWIDADDGRVTKSELVLYTGNGTALVTTMFQPDESSGVSVPFEMREEYRLQRGRITATATYSRFRRFEVSTKTAIKPAQP
jgi:hypothetical protein